MSVSAEGYTVQPLSDELEKRIRERINVLKSMRRQDQISQAHVNALLWVLHEAEMITVEGKVA